MEELQAKKNAFRARLDAMKSQREVSLLAMAMLESRTALEGNILDDKTVDVNSLGDFYLVIMLRMKMRRAIFMKIMRVQILCLS